MFLLWLLSNQNIKIPRSVTSRHAMPCLLYYLGPMTSEGCWWDCFAVSVHCGEERGDILLYGLFMLMRLKPLQLSNIEGQGWSAASHNCWSMICTPSRAWPAPATLLAGVSHRLLWSSGLPSADWAPWEPHSCCSLSCQSGADVQLSKDVRVRK